MVLLFAATSRADAWRPTGIACYSAAGLNGQCETVRRGAGLWDVAVAPGGRQAYGISYDDSALLIFDRDPGTGRLTQRGAGGCLSEDGSGGQCVKAKGISHPLKILVSPDGNNVYVGAGTPGGVATFNRNTTTGDLTQDPSLAG